MAATALPRPSKGFTPAKAQKWVMTAALVTAIVYVVRHLTEPEAARSPATSAARQFLGQGSPPNLAQWLIAYSVGFLSLSLLTVAAPELAAAFAMFYLGTVFLESGGQLATDLRNIEAGAGGGPSAASIGASQSAATLAAGRAQEKKIVGEINAGTYYPPPATPKTPAPPSVFNTSPTGPLVP